MARTAKARAGGLGKGGWATQEEMNNQDVIAAATAPAPPVKTVLEYRTFQKLSERYRIGNKMSRDGVAYYILVDTTTMQLSDFLPADAIRTILFIEWLGMILEQAHARND